MGCTLCNITDKDSNPFKCATETEKSEFLNELAHDIASYHPDIVWKINKYARKLNRKQKSRRFSSPYYHKVAELRQQNPKIKAVDMAKQLGTSKEWIGCVLTRLGLPTNFRAERRFCSSCGKRIDSRGRTGLCKTCRKRTYTTLICEMCKREYQVLLSQFRKNQKRGYQHHFCGRRCMALYRWKTNVLGMHRKFDWDRVRSLRESGYSLSQIAREIGSSPSYICGITRKLGLPRRKYVFQA